jgi:2-methylisocitrate lyase-like PEP mutase family enzyme
MSTTRKILRSVLNDPGIIVAPGAFDALSAKLVERAGFPAVYMTGFGVSASRAGLPDLGLLTRAEFVDQITQMARAVGIPLIADADTGFGNALQLERTMQLYEQAGAAALQLEDQDLNRRCGHLAGKEVVPASEMVAKIRVMKAAQRDPETVLIARTDARAVAGLDEALRRGEAYLKAGADVLFIEAPQSVAELERVATEFRGAWLLANMPEGGLTPYLSYRELESLGYKIAIYPVSTLFSATRAMQGALTELHCQGRLVSPERHVDFADFVEIIGASAYLEKLNHYEALKK